MQLSCRGWHSWPGQLAGLLILVVLLVQLRTRMEDGNTKERRVTKVIAKQLRGSDEVESVRITFKKEGVIGKGSFGVVQLVRLHRVCPVGGEEEGQRPVPKLRARFAMKTVVARHKESRELGILKQLNHPNIVPLRFFFYSHSKTGTSAMHSVPPTPVSVPPGQGTLLNLLFDVQPSTMYDLLGELEGRGELMSRSVIHCVRLVKPTIQGPASRLRPPADPGPGLPARPGHRPPGPQAQEPAGQAAEWPPPDL